MTTNIICGDLEHDNIKYKFDFRNNILVLVPEKLESYPKWQFEHIGKKEESKCINIEGTTNLGQYICFVHVKFSDIGRGILQAFVPAYIICKSNLISPLPKCENIEKIKIYGECLDKFYFPKRIIDNNDFFSEETAKFEVKKMKTDDFIVKNDKFSYGVSWNIPISSNINVVLDVKSYLEVNFKNLKDIDDILEYYLKIKKFFSFINNRKYIKFNKFIASKKIKLNYDINSESTELKEIYFEFFFVEPDEKIDLSKSINYIHLEDLNNKFTEIYNIVTENDFLTEYYPLSESDNRYVDNDKFLKVASAFESEFDKANPNYKSSNSVEYDFVKKKILNNISLEKQKNNNEILSSDDSLKIKSLKKINKEYSYFEKIIKNIDGTLQEKIVFCLKKYGNIIDSKKELLIKNYDIEKVKDGVLAEAFKNRRNKISHGKGTDIFSNAEIIAYELLRLCIYCLTLERCNLNTNDIKMIIEKIF